MIGNEVSRLVLSALFAGLGAWYLAAASRELFPLGRRRRLVPAVGAGLQAVMCAVMIGTSWSWGAGIPAIAQVTVFTAGGGWFAGQALFGALTHPRDGPGRERDRGANGCHARYGGRRPGPGGDGPGRARLVGERRLPAAGGTLASPFGQELAARMALLLLIVPLLTQNGRGGRRADVLRAAAGGRAPGLGRGRRTRGGGTGRGAGCPPRSCTWRRWRCGSAVWWCSGSRCCPRCAVIRAPTRACGDGR